MAEYLYELGSDINHKDANLDTPLHVTCDKGHLPIVHFLLENHAEVNFKNSSLGQTPLHYAAKNGYVKIVEMLIDYHINSRFFKNVKLDKEINLNA